MATIKRDVSSKAPVNRAIAGRRPVKHSGSRPAVGTPRPEPKPGGPPKAPNKKNELQAFLWAEGEQESGNNYLAVNPSSGALGRWQVMPSNLSTWLPESGQSVLTPDQFLHSHAAQNAVALTILGGYFKRYGPAGAAAMWYSGQPDPNVTYGDPPVNVYVNDVLTLMGSDKVGTITTTGTSQLLPWSVPHPDRSDTWASQVELAAGHLHEVAVSMHNAAIGVRSSYT